MLKEPHAGLNFVPFILSPKCEIYTTVIIIGVGASKCFSGNFECLHRDFTYVKIAEAI